MNIRNGAGEETSKVVRGFLGMSPLLPSFEFYGQCTFMYDFYFK